MVGVGIDGVLPTHGCEMLGLVLCEKERRPALAESNTLLLGCTSIALPYSRLGACSGLDKGKKIVFLVGCLRTVLNL